MLPMYAVRKTAIEEEKQLFAWQLIEEEKNKIN